MYVLNSLLLMFSVSLILGILIALFAKAFEIKVDPRVALLTEALPSYNCGACGYPGCEQYAAALIGGHIPENKCTPGGKETAERIRQILNGNSAASAVGADLKA